VNLRQVGGIKWLVRLVFSISMRKTDVPGVIETGRADRGSLEGLHATR